MIRNIFKSIVNILVYCVVSIAILSAILVFAGITPYITMSGSMEPNIKTGSVCFVNTNIKYDEIRENDVIAFQTSNESLVTHRVLNITENGIETKGDNNNTADIITTKEDNFIGRTIGSIPYVGYGLMYLKQPLCVSIIVIVVLVLLSLNIVDFLYSKKENKNVQK